MPYYCFCSGGSLGRAERLHYKNNIDIKKLYGTLMSIYSLLQVVDNLFKTNRKIPIF